MEKIGTRTKKKKEKGVNEESLGFKVVKQQLQLTNQLKLRVLVAGSPGNALPLAFQEVSNMALYPPVQTGHLLK